MKDVRIRLLFPPLVREDEVRAAIRGMERFRAFGVLCDCAGLGREDRAALRGVRNGGAMKSMITATAPFLTFSDFHGGLWEAVVARDIIPVGLTASCMSEIVWSEYPPKVEIRLGLSKENEGAIVSLFRIRGITAAAGQSDATPYRAGAEEKLALKAIETAVVHELGHVFGKKGHCEKEGCVMQANRDFADFMDRFVMAGADFCRNCAATVNSAVCRMAASF